MSQQVWGWFLFCFILFCFCLCFVFEPQDVNMETMKDNSCNGHVSVIETIYTCFGKMSASLRRRDSEVLLKLYMALLMCPQYCHRLHSETLLFQTLLITLIWISFLSLDLQHLFINVPKYVNHHMFNYVNILLGRNKTRSHSIFGKGTVTPENQSQSAVGKAS